MVDATLTPAGTEADSVVMSAGAAEAFSNTLHINKQAEKQASNQSNLQVNIKSEIDASHATSDFFLDN